MKNTFNRKLDWQKRKEALGKIKDQRLLKRLTIVEDFSVRIWTCQMISDQKLLAQLARDAVSAYVRRNACRRLNDRGPLAQLARDAPDSKVRLAAFYRASSQLVDDHEVRRKVVYDCLAQMKRGSLTSHDVLDELVCLSAHEPGLIRQFWPQIKSVCHEDNPSCRHTDKHRSGSDCTHTDNQGADPYHRDHSNSHLFERFPPTARS
jgi:hypothetical protein